MRWLILCLCVAALSTPAHGWGGSIWIRCCPWEWGVEIWFVAASSPDTQVFMDSGAVLSRSEGRRKRQAVSTEETEIAWMVNNGTLADMVDMLDNNCDGTLDIDEWRAAGSIKDFCTILETFDSNGDEHISLDEIETFQFKVDPDVKEYMLMPMERFDEMMTMIDEGGEGDDGDKGRKGPSE